MYIQNNLEQLRVGARKVATYRILKSLRVGLIIFGVLTLPALSSLADEKTPAFLRTVLTAVGALGAVMVACGIWFCVQQRRVGTVIGGVLLMAIGLSNCALTIAEAAAGEEFTGWKGFWFVFGIMQIYWGVQMAASYRRLAGADSTSLPQELLAWLKDNLAFLSKKTCLADPKVLEVMVKGPQVWRVNLYPDGAVAVRVGSLAEIIIALPQQVALEASISDKSRVPAVLRLHERTLTGTMIADHFERFRRWQASVAAAEALPMLQPAPDAPPPLPTFPAAPAAN
ncbi:MAG: hypothetical protein LLG01_13810 [Planctomycetaceae bacterium]|nr:hypothetical protein [Planctomycetaceae bacterium]